MKPKGHKKSITFNNFFNVRRNIYLPSENFSKEYRALKTSRELILANQEKLEATRSLTRQDSQTVFSNRDEIEGLEIDIDKLYNKKKADLEYNTKEYQKTQRTDFTNYKLEDDSEKSASQKNLSNYSTKLYFKIANLREKFQEMLRKKPNESPSLNVLNGGMNNNDTILGHTPNETSFSKNILLTTTKQKGQRLRQNLGKEKDLDSALAKSLTLLSREKNWISPNRSPSKVHCQSRLENSCLTSSIDQLPVMNKTKADHFKRKLLSEREGLSSMFQRLVDMEIKISEDSLSKIESVKNLHDLKQLNSFSVKEVRRIRKSILSSILKANEEKSSPLRVVEMDKEKTIGSNIIKTHFSRKKKNKEASKSETNLFYNKWYIPKEQQFSKKVPNAESQIIKQLKENENYYYDSLNKDKKEKTVLLNPLSRIIEKSEDEIKINERHENLKKNFKNQIMTGKFKEFLENNKMRIPWFIDKYA